jgi:putative ABC transport system permease protein
MFAIVDQISKPLRQLMKDPVFTAAAVVTLTLGIAANTSMFSVVYAVLLRPLPYKDASQVAVLWASVPEKGIPADWTSFPTIQDWRNESKSFEDMATELRINSATLTGRDESEEIKVGRVSANLFPLLGVHPVLGRSYTSEEEARREPLVVISSSLWRSQFASSQSVIGQHLEVDHKQATIVGVMPPSFAYPSADTQLWLPLTFVPQWTAFLTARQSDGFRAIARLKPGVSLKGAQSEMDLIAQRLGGQYPNTDAGKGIAVVPLARQMIDPHVRTALWMLFGAVNLVLLIGCSNVASLMLARGTARQREFAIRAALGASRFRILRLLMGESLVLATVSSVLGLGIAIVFLRLLPRIVPTDLASVAHVTMSVPVLLFALALPVLTGILCGFFPAWKLSLGELHGALKGDSRTQAGQRSHSRMRSSLVVSEFALAVILLLGGGLFVRSLLLLQRENLGFTSANLLVATLTLPMDETTQARAAKKSFEDVLEQVKTLPGVADAAVTGSLFSDYTPNTQIVTEGTEHSSAKVQRVPSTLAIVSETFFRTMEISLLRGRSFSEYDSLGHPAVAVINKSMADQFWPRENPIGKRFRYGSPGAIDPEWLTVIGLAGDVNPNGPGSRPIATFYRAYRQAPWLTSMDIVVRCNSGNPGALGDGLRQSVRSVDHQIPRFEVQTVTAVLAEMSATRRLETWLLGVFAGVALCLATVGIYSVMSYLVSKRTQEIGLRMAFGATEQDVLRLVVGFGIRLAGLGILLGLGVSFFAMRLIRHLLFGVSTSDPLTVLLVSITLFVAALAASYFPARKATRLDPLASIRCE